MRRTIGTAGSNQKKQKNKSRRWKSSSGFWTKPPQAVWYIKIVIFLYRVSVFLSICGGSQQGTDNCISFIFTSFFLSLGVNHFCLAPLWYCWTKKKQKKKRKKYVWTCRNNKCCFLDVSRIVGEGLKSVGHKFYKCVFVTKKNPGTAGRRCPTCQLTCRSRFSSIHTDCRCISLVLYLEKKKKRRRRDELSRRRLTIFFSNTVSWGVFSPLVQNPPVGNTHNATAKQPRRPVVVYECFLLFVRVNECVYVCMCQWKNALIRYKMRRYSMPLFFLYVGKTIYIHWHCSSSSLSVSVRSLCLKMESVQQKYHLYLLSFCIPRK